MLPSMNVRVWNDRILFWYTTIDIGRFRTLVEDLISRLLSRLKKSKKYNTFHLLSLKLTSRLIVSLLDVSVGSTIHTFSCFRQRNSCKSS